MSKKTKNKRPAEMFAERLRMSNSDLKVILAMDQLRRKKQEERLTDEEIVSSRKQMYYIKFRKRLQCRLCFHKCSSRYSFEIFIVVGLPCGQVYGLFKLNKLCIKFSTSCLLKSILALTAALQATVAINLSSTSFIEVL